MKRGGTIGSAVGALMLAVLMLRAPSTGPGVSQEQSAAPQRQTRVQASPVVNGVQPQPLPQSGPWQASQQHFLGISGQCDPATANQVTRWCIPADTTVQALIAIAPDPVHTHMSLVFDRSLEAIRLGAESMSYVEDRYWLPWSSEPQPEYADYESHQKAAQEDADKQKQPGLLIFRHNGESSTNVPQLLYVFLVVDTSTTGINGIQFNNAMQYVGQVACQGACGTDTPIKIFGPTFSGSLESLKRLADKPNITAYSGTVSSSAAIQAAKFQALKFKSFMADTAGAIQLLIRSLEKDREVRCVSKSSGNLAQIAILSEAATTYGAATKDIKSSAPEADVKPSTPEGDVCYDSFSYPREIASLRNAYIKAANAAAQSRSPQLSQGYLPFSLGEQAANTNDQAPSFSKEQSPVSNEAVLMDLANRLRAGQYRYVGVIGSNVLDVLFLTRFLRTACPNARLFVINADLLFERQIDNAPYIGTLALTTYPMFGRNLDWASPNRLLPRLPFADQYEEGQYNAIVAALADRPAAGESPLVERSEPQTYIAPADTLPKKQQHPVWLTAVSSAGYWPIRILSGDDRLLTSDPAGWKPRLRQQDFSPAWRILLSVVGGFALVHIWVLLTVSPISRRFRDFSTFGGARAQRLFFIHLSSATLTLALLMLVAPAYEFGPRSGAYLRSIEGLILATITLLPITCLVLHLNDSLRRKTECQTAAVLDKVRFRTAYRAVTAGALGVWLVAIVLGFFWYREFADDASHYGFFFAFRSVNLATGLSPTTPMLPLLATIYVWCLFETWRLRFNDNARPRIYVCPESQTEMAARSSTVNAAAAPSLPGSTREAAIAETISGFLLDYKYVAAVVILFLVWMLFVDPQHPFELFEKPGFGIIYEVLFCGVVLLNLSSGFRLGQVWSQLRGLLGELERSPIREAFNRLKGFGWSPIWRQGGEDVDWIYMSRSIEALRHVQFAQTQLMAEAETGFDDHLKTDIDGLVEHAYSLRKCAAAVGKYRFFLPFRARNEYLTCLRSAGKPEVPEASGLVTASRQLLDGFRTLQCNLAKMQTRIWAILVPRWDSGNYAPVNGGSEKDDNHEAPEDTDPKTLQIRQMEEFIALRYVNFIRGAMGHMRHMLWVLAISFTLMLTSLNLYSFEPHQTLLWSFTAIFFGVGLVILIVLLQVHRDPVLNRITDTKPNELGFEFYLRIVSVGVLPLLTLLATHFPSIARSLLGFLQPSLEALK